MKKTEAAVNTSDFYIGLVILFLIVSAIVYFFPASIPFGLFEFFKFNFNWATLSGIPWMLLLFGPVLNIVVKIFTRNEHSKNIETVNTFDQNIWTSIKAGIFEEATYRWLVFYFMIVSFTLRDIIFNWLMTIGWISAIFTLPWWAIGCIIVVLNFLGVVAYLITAERQIGLFWSSVAFVVLVMVLLIDVALILGIVKWWYIGVLLPVVNFVTLGKMSAQLFGYSWMVGAALISSNWSFGQGHVYHGCIGWLNSWIIGMLMFWFTFNFGILFAMLVHAVYDIVIDVISYTDARLELATS